MPRRTMPFRTGGRPAGIATALLLACAATAHGAEPTALDAVVVKGQALAPAEAASHSVTGFDAETIRAAAISRPQQLFDRVPGMSVRTLGLPGVADNFTLRGFGGGGHGGDIGFVLDGIPLNEAMSHADGYGDLDVVIPLELRRLEVLRGPVSALYGNYHRAGGVLLQTRRGGEYRELDVAAGRFGSVDLQAALGTEGGDGQALNLAAQAVRSDGFRPQSKSERATLAGAWSGRPTPRLEAAVSGRLHVAEADNPGYLPLDLYRRDPYGKDPRAQNDGAEKTFGTLRGDLAYRLSDRLKLLTFGYATAQDFIRWFTRGPAEGDWRQREESYDRRVFGTGASLNGQGRLGGVAVAWTAGVEGYRERTDYLYYEDIQYRQRNPVADQDRRYVLENQAAFAEAEFEFTPLFVPKLGLRADRFRGDCEVRAVELSDEPCGKLAAVSHVSPKLGLRSTVADWLTLRASWAEGFALAEGAAKYAPGAEGLDPAVFRQRELGASLEFEFLSLDAALFRIDSSAEIGRDPAGDYENFGATRRQGLEVAAQWFLHEDFDLSVNWAGTRSEVRRHRDPALVGKRVAGVPRHVTTVSAGWRPLPAWQGTLAWRRLGDYAIDAANSRITGGYALFDLMLSYQHPGDRAPRVYLAVDNLTDRVYATSVSSVGYATGAPRTWRLGVQASF